MAGDITPQQSEELEIWLSESEEHRQILEAFEKHPDLCGQYEKFRSVNAGKMWLAVEKHMTASRRKHWVVRWYYAACVLIFIGLGIFLSFYLPSLEKEKAVPVADTEWLVPGRSQAVLCLADGKQIILPDSNISIQEGLVRKIDNSLIYEPGVAAMEEKWNTLKVPRGGEFQLTLSDGSRVWLNAGSEITYPQIFTGKERGVKIVGEAYFEIEKDSLRPFRVRAGEVAIKVLGTSFNVKSYPDDRQITTTLLEGGIELVAGKKICRLKPEQQAVWKAGEDELVVNAVKASDFIAWRKGRFIFRRERMEIIMGDIARWYNAEVYYRDPEVKDVTLSGSMERYGSIEETLEKIEKTGKVSFHVDKNTIIVSKKR